MSLAPYSLGVAFSTGVSGLGISSANSAVRVSVLSLDTGAFDSSVIDDGRPLPSPREIAAANRHVTVDAGYSADWPTAPRNAGTRRKTDSVNASPASSYLRPFYRVTALNPAFGRPVRTQAAHEKPLIHAGRAEHSTEWVPIRLGAFEAPYTPFVHFSRVWTAAWGTNHAGTATQRMLLIRRYRAVRVRSQCVRPCASLALPGQEP